MSLEVSKSKFVWCQVLVVHLGFMAWACVMVQSKLEMQELLYSKSRNSKVLSTLLWSSSAADLIPVMVQAPDLIQRSLELGCIFQKDVGLLYGYLFKQSHTLYYLCVFIIEHGKVFGQERYSWIHWKVKFYFSSHRVSSSEMRYFAQVFATFGFTFPLFCNIPENQGSDVSSFSTLNKCHLCQASIDRANVCC